MTNQPGSSASSGRRVLWALVGAGTVLSLVIAGIVSRFASSSPDGLEKVAKDTGFIADAQANANAHLPLADYGTVGGIPVGVAGIIGVVIVLVLAFALFTLLGRRRSTASDG